MRRFAAFVLASLMCLAGLSGCGDRNEKVVLQDGTYYAEFENFDGNGYKDFMRVTIKDGAVSNVEYDALNAEGKLKTQDEKLESDMSKIHETYPSRYSADLVNQLLEKGSIDQVDAIAGATWSSESFKALYNALLANNMQTGSTDTLIVENVDQPAK